MIVFQRNLTIYLSLWNIYLQRSSIYSIRLPTISFYLYYPSIYRSRQFTISICISDLYPLPLPVHLSYPISLSLFPFAREGRRGGGGSFFILPPSSTLRCWHLISHPHWAVSIYFRENFRHIISLKHYPSQKRHFAQLWITWRFRENRTDQLCTDISCYIKPGSL
jgi:hypothetical protein